MTMIESRKRATGRIFFVGLTLVLGAVLQSGCSDGNSGGSGDPHVRVFATSLSYDGAFAGGLAGADAECTAAATAATLSGTWTAWLSDDTTDAVDRIFDGGTSYRLLDGTVIADDQADLLDGTLDAPINIDENGALIAAVGFPVWTGTNTSGTSGGFPNCLNWTSNLNGQSGRFGFTSDVDAGWTNRSTNQACDFFNRLYCFDDAVTN